MGGCGEAVLGVGLLRNGKDFNKEIRTEGRRRMLGNVKSNSKDTEEGNMLKRSPSKII